MYWQPVRTCEAMAHRNLQSKGVRCTRSRDHTTDGKINSLEHHVTSRSHICRFNERFHAISPPSFVYSLQQITADFCCSCSVYCHRYKFIQIPCAAALEAHLLCRKTSTHPCRTNTSKTSASLLRAPQCNSVDFFICHLSLHHKSV